jgi:endoglucanase
MKKAILLLICFLAGFAASANFRQFEDGDRVCFVGDSITHGGSYHTFIYLFYATRFPDRDIRMYNCGVAGDTAEGTIRRFEWDVEPKHPTIATVMLGMNDVGRDNYGLQEPTPEQINAREDKLASYAENMDTLCSMLRDEDAELVIIGPSIYDQSADIERENLFGVNDALIKCVSYCRDLAGKFDAGFVDFNAPLLLINNKYQKSDASFTIVGQDRVHPGREGHFVMAAVFLEAQNVSEYVSKTMIDVDTGNTDAINCELSSLKISDEGVEYQCKEYALPFPAKVAIESPEKFVDFSERFNKEMIVVKGLKAGEYELLIDDVAVGSYSDRELAAGIDIAGNEKTPQYKQAVSVYEANAERAAASYVLRSLAHVEHQMLKSAVVYPDDMDDIKPKLALKIKEAEGKSWYNYYVGQVQRYFENKPHEKEYKDKIEGLIDEMYEINKPVKHRFVIKRLPS